MATVTAFETHRHFLGVVRLDLELPDCIAAILEELASVRGLRSMRRRWPRPSHRAFVPSHSAD
jgi:hypothetical protein